MLLTVVIPVYNEVDTIEEIVRRVLHVELPLEKELIIVDDGSTDGCQAVINQLTEEFDKDRIRVFFHSKNRGKGAALRTGFSATKGDIVIIQDAGNV